MTAGPFDCDSCRMVPREIEDANSPIARVGNYIVEYQEIKAPGQTESTYLQHRFFPCPESKKIIFGHRGDLVKCKELPGECNWLVGSSCFDIDADGKNIVHGESYCASRP